MSKEQVLSSPYESTALAVTDVVPGIQGEVMGFSSLLV